MQQESVSPNFNGGSGNLKVLPGLDTVLGVGWGFGNGFRAEVEGNWMMNRFNGFTNAGAPSTAGGTEQKFGFMVNGYYDFNNVSPWVIPYVGLGVGWEAAQWRGVSAYTLGVTPGSAIDTRTSTLGAFAYQAMLGAAFPIRQVPGLAATAEYRFMGMTSGNRNYATTSGGPDVQAGSEYNHAILIGLRYAFNNAPPAPPPTPVAAAAPAPAPARSYLVFFDWDQATLTARAQQIIKEAAENSTKVQYTRIEVNGYTDTSGTPQYNQGLSMRRAQAVEGELVRDGVPQNAIGIHGYGDTHLLVPTGAGVREPQNRRVEIIIR
jgi:outer membrane protein OmpA-like peptidoglycan-associated protein